MILRILFLLCLAFAGLIFPGAPVTLAAPVFDPARVQSADCRKGDYRCGFQPPAADDLAAVPLADAVGSATGDGAGGSNLPARVDLSAFMPPVGDQGPRASGVAWALAYGLMSYQARRESATEFQKPDPRKSSYNPCAADAPDGGRLRSPAELYNALNQNRDAGIDLLQAGRYLVERGAVSCAAAPYEPASFAIAPVDRTTLADAPRMRARGLQRLSPSDVSGIRARLAQGQPVVIGFTLYADFYQLGQGVYELRGGRQPELVGGHAVVLVGYDDAKKSASGDPGAFRFLNSFSRDWGDQGYGWMSYRAFRQIVRAAVILEPAAGAVRFAETAGPGLQPPTEVVASRGQFADRVVIHFEPSADAIAYEIQRAWPQDLSENKTQPFETIGYSREPTFVDRLAQPEIAFRYRVRAIGVGGASAPSSQVGEGFATKGAKNSLPLQVVGLRAPVHVVRGAPVVDLQWNRATGAQAYRVMRFDADRGSWRVLTPFLKETVFRDARPRTAAWNVYRVQAINDAGRAEFSASVSALIGGPGIAPAPVVNLRASRGRFADRIELTWDAVPGADRYRVYRLAAGDRELEGPFEVTTTGYVDQQLEQPEDRNGAYIAYRVAAGNAAGFSPPGDAVFGYARPAQGDADTGTLLPPPENLTLDVTQASRSGVRLSWSPVPGAVEYYVLRKRVGETDFGFVHNVAAGERPVFQEEFPGTDGELFLYTVRTKAAGPNGSESQDSQVVAVFKDPARSATRKRFFWATGQESRSAFEGVWTTMDWDGESGPRRLEMRISQNGPRFEGHYRIGNNPSRKFAGEYVYGSQVLEAPGFRMELLEQSGARPTPAGAGLESIVRIRSRELSPYDVDLTFERAAP